MQYLVVGAGRMGSVVARQLPGRTRKIVIDIDLEKAVLLAEQVEGIPSDSLDSAGDADLVAVVLPTPAVIPGSLNLLRANSESVGRPFPPDLQPAQGSAPGTGQPPGGGGRKSQSSRGARPGG